MVNLCIVSRRYIRKQYQWNVRYNLKHSYIPDIIGCIPLFAEKAMTGLKTSVFIYSHKYSKGIEVLLFSRELVPSFLQYLPKAGTLCTILHVFYSLTSFNKIFNNLSCNKRKLWVLKQYENIINNMMVIA